MVVLVLKSTPSTLQAATHNMLAHAPEQANVHCPSSTERKFYLFDVSRELADGGVMAIPQSP